jgi:cell division protein FtsW (lipid II flippase)
MDRFISLKYLLTPRPDPNFQFTKLIFAVGLILLAVGILLSFYRKKYVKNPIIKKMIRKYPGQLKTYGLLTLILLLVRETGIPFLSMRIWWFVLAAFFLYSLLKFVFTFKKDYKKRLHQAEKRGLVNKYLPKKKR